MEDPLDEHYHTMLRYLKTQCVQMTNSSNIKLCTMWLEKLETVQEKRLRNQYMLEMVKSVQSGVLSPPFDAAPPNGYLAPISQTFGTTEYRDDDSWCDMSDGSADGGDGTAEISIKDTDRPESSSPRNNIATTSSTPLNSTIESLVEVKKYFKDAHALVNKWKCKHDALQDQLKQLEMEKSRLQAAHNTLNLDISQLKKEKLDLQHEIETFKKKLNEANTKLENTKLEYKQQLKQENWDKSVTIEDKDRTIAKLENLLQEETQKAENATKSTRGLEDQLVTLKKTVADGKKLSQKMERDHNDRMEKLKKEFEMREKALELKLTKEKFDCVNRNNASKQQEFDHIIKALEEKYINMLETLQLENSIHKNQTKEVITGLKSILDNHEITY